MKLNYRRTFFIGLAFLSITAFWQLYDNMIPLMLQNTFHLGETITGVLMAMDNVLAIFLLPIFGSISDKVDTRFGKRTPFIVIGTLLAVIFLMLLPVADNGTNLVLFLVALFALLIAMGLYRSPAVALMPDLTPGRLRSKGNAIINLMGAVGGVYTLIMIKVLVGSGDRPNYMPLFSSIAAIMVISVVVLVLTINEKKLAVKVAEEEAEWKASLDAAELEAINREEEKERGDNLKSAEADQAKMPKEVLKSLIFMLLSIFMWYVAYNAVTTAFSRYATKVLGLENGGFANCLMVATVAAIISYVPIGNLSSKIGRKKTIMGGVVLMTACYLYACFVSTYSPLINVAFALIGVGWAAINVNSYPMIVEMSKGSDIGKYTGMYYTFSMAAQIFTPILSGFLLENVSYRTLFPYAVFFSALAFVTMTQVRHGDSKPVKKKDILENFDVDD